MSKLKMKSVNIYINKLLPRGYQSNFEENTQQVAFGKIYEYICTKIKAR